MIWKNERKRLDRLILVAFSIFGIPHTARQEQRGISLYGLDEQVSSPQLQQKIRSRNQKAVHRLSKDPWGFLENPPGNTLWQIQSIVEKVQDGNDLLFKGSNAFFADIFISSAVMAPSGVIQIISSLFPFPCFPFLVEI